MVEQNVVTAEISPSTYRILESFVSRESCPATSILEDSMHMYAKRAETDRAELLAETLAWFDAARNNRR